MIRNETARRKEIVLMYRREDMNKYTITDYLTGKHFTRINKTEARRRYNAGERIAVTPCKINPAGMMGFVSIYNLTGSVFDQLIRGFEYCSCNHETGYYAAYYTIG